MRAAIAARGSRVAAGAVSAVLAAEGRAAARKPQEPQQPQWVSISAISTEPDEAELEERMAMAVASVPEPFLDAWVRLQCQRPIGVGETVWRQAIDAAGRFLVTWGSLAIEFAWTPADLFDVPRDGRPGGLAWFLQGEAVRALGPDHAVTTSERVFDRIIAQEATPTLGPAFKFTSTALLKNRI